MPADPGAAAAGELPPVWPDSGRIAAPGRRCGVIGVGYQGQDIGSFTAALEAAAVRLVVDVRLNPVSRKTGFSKHALQAGLELAGIGYRHYPELGNPRWNRDGFAGAPAELAAARARFSSLTSGDEASARIALIAAAAREGLVAVMCFEVDESRCHRKVILDRVRATALPPGPAA